MQGYIKHFTDGSTEKVTDDLVMKKQASWSRGKLDNMSAADLHMSGLLLTISGQGSYWVADDMMNIYRGPNITVPSQFLARRLQKQITEDEVNKWATLEIRKNSYHMYMASKEGPSAAYKILPEHVGQWLTLELDLDKKTVRYRLANNKG